jgi:HSP20 family protein
MADDSEKLPPDDPLLSIHWERHLVVIKKSSVWQPPTDAYETADRFVILIELAGMRDGEFTVNLVDRRLIVTGRRHRPPHPETAVYHQLEVLYGEFRIEVHLPWGVEREGVVASYEDGFLRVELPRRKQNLTIHVIDLNRENEDQP